MKNAVFVLILIALTGVILVFALGGFGPQLDVATDRSDDEQSLTSEEDYVQKLTEIKMRRTKVLTGITRLEKRKAENVQLLKDKGIRKLVDAQGDPEARVAINSLKDLSSLIGQRNKEIEALDKAIARLDGMLNKIRRENVPGLTEEQQIELRAIQLELDEKLGLDDDLLFEDAEIDEMLNKDLGKESDGSNDGDSIEDLLNDNE